MLVLDADLEIERIFLGGAELGPSAALTARRLASDATDRDGEFG